MGTARITAPVEGYTGDGPGGVPFTDGVAVSDDPAIIGYCQGAGYRVERLDDPDPSDADPDPSDTPPNTDPPPSDTPSDTPTDGPQATKPAGRSRTRKGSDA